MPNSSAFTTIAIAIVGGVLIQQIKFLMSDYAEKRDGLVIRIRIEKNKFMQRHARIQTYIALIRKSEERCRECEAFLKESPAVGTVPPALPEQVQEKILSNLIILSSERGKLEGIQAADMSEMQAIRTAQLRMVKRLHGILQSYFEGVEPARAEFVGLQVEELEISSQVNQALDEFESQEAAYKEEIEVEFARCNSEIDRLLDRRKVAWGIITVIVMSYILSFFLHW